MSRYTDTDALEKILLYWIEEKGYARKKHSEEFVEGMEDAYRRVLCFVKMEPKTEIIRCHECRYNDGGYCSMLRERTKRNGVEVRIWSQFFCAYGEKEGK